MWNKADILSLLLTPQEELLFQKANEVTENIFGKGIFLRGLIEFSNICEKNCYYCGLRRDNRSLHRYKMSQEEIVHIALWAYQKNYKTILLQSGEVISESHLHFLTEVIEEIQRQTKQDLTISLSLGELPRIHYEKLFAAGARRYLLRMETSNPALYQIIHPEECSYVTRVRCLKELKSIGFQLGTGSLIGLPGQTMEHLAEEILFFHKIDADMIGMGPLLSHSKAFLQYQRDKKELLSLCLRMIATTRILMPDLLLTATTAMQALDPQGREKALLSGANVWMPSLTPLEYRKDYELYSQKPCLNETKEECHSCTERRIQHVGKTISWQRGDPPHFFRGKT